MKITKHIEKFYIQTKESMFGKLNNIVTHNCSFSHIKYRICHYQQKLSIII